MKLLMITGLGSARDLASGKMGAFYNTLEEFHKYWDRIDIIAPRNKQATGGKLLFGNVYIHVSPWPLVFHPFYFIWKSLQILKSNDYLMTVHEFPPFYNGIAARILWQLKKVPYVLEIFHVPGYPVAASIKELIYRFLFKLFIRFDTSKAKAVRVMNRKQVPDLLIKSGVPENKIRYIPAIYVDLDIFKPMDLPKEYDLIFVGRLEKNKGVNFLVDAVNILKNKKNKKNIKAIIVGTGPLLKGLVKKIHNLKLEENIILHGWARDQKEVARLLNKSKIMAMPSYNEGGPRVAIEAMACGIPVLASPVGVVPDIYTAEDSLLLIPGSEADYFHAADMIANKATTLLNEPETYKFASNRCLDKAKNFEKRSAIKNYADKIKEII